jgi:PAS domain-containing protein
MRDGRFIDCNPATLRMFGCAGADIIGVTPNVFSPLAIRRSDWG